MTHLWEVKHDYYSNKGNYFASPADEIFETFDTFTEYLEGFDPDFLNYNVIYRWDWKTPWELLEETDGDCGEDFYIRDGDDLKINPKYHIWNPDQTTRESRLELYLILPRKGIYTWKEIKVARSEEQQIKEHLQLHFNYLKSLWLPLE